MTTYRYTGPRRLAVRAGVCPICGKKGRRQTTIEKTVNPFNRNTDGSVKTWDEVAADVRAEAAAWEAQPFEHASCKGGSA